MTSINNKLLFSAVLAIMVTVSAQAEDGLKSNTVVSDLDVFGRVMFDFAHASSDDTGFEISETELRNVRLGMSGQLNRDLKFKVELHGDDSGAVVFTDAYLKYSFDSVSLRVGQFKTPNSFDEQTFSRFITLQERSAFTDAFELDRRLGIELSGKGKKFTYMVGVFAQNFADSDKFGGYAIAGRATYNPAINVDDLNIHTGLSVRFRDLKKEQPKFRYRQRPVSRVPGRIIGTGRISDSDVFVGAEAAMTKGAFWVASEVSVTFADCSVCADDPTFSGGYLEAGFMLGGKRVIKGGKFIRPEVDNHTLGAASFVLRFDKIDLSQGMTKGGSYNAFILGADWWPRGFVRLGVNGYVVDAKLGASMSGLDPVFTAAVASGLGEEKITGVTFRTQIDF